MSSQGVLIVAAGSSQRFGQDKLMALVQGRPLISYALQSFVEIPSMEEIILVVAAGREEAFSQLLQEMNISGLGERIKIVSGGKDRHESVRHGLTALSSNIQWVAIHDGARPLISCSMIELVFQQAREHGAAALAVPITETLHRVSSEQVAEITVDRTNLWSMQTPQVFKKTNLQTLKKTNSPTDEVSAVLQHGVKVYLVENHEPNIKVTYPRDLSLVRAYLSIAHKQ